MLTNIRSLSPSIFGNSAGPRVPVSLWITRSLVTVTFHPLGCSFSGSLLRDICSGASRCRFNHVRPNISMQLAAELGSGIRRCVAACQGAYDSVRNLVLIHTHRRLLPSPVLPQQSNVIQRRPLALNCGLRAYPASAPRPCMAPGLGYSTTYPPTTRPCQGAMMSVPLGTPLYSCYSHPQSGLQDAS